MEDVGRYKDSKEVKRRGKASFISQTPRPGNESQLDQDNKKINKLIKECKKQMQDSSISLSKLDELLNEAAIS